MLIAFRNFMEYITTAVVFAEGEQDVLKRANHSLSEFVKLLEKFGEDARFGAFIAVFGVGTSQLSCRFRLFARSVWLFLCLRRSIRLPPAGSKGKTVHLGFDWARNESTVLVLEQKEVDKYLHDWLALLNNKHYRQFASQIEHISGYLFDSTLSIAEHSMLFCDYLVGTLMPDEVPWPDAFAVRAPFVVGAGGTEPADTHAPDM